MEREAERKGWEKRKERERWRTVAAKRSSSGNWGMPRALNLVQSGLCCVRQVILERVAQPAVLRGTTARRHALTAACGQPSEEAAVVVTSYGGREREGHKEQTVMALKNQQRIN